MDYDESSNSGSDDNWDDIEDDVDTNETEQTVCLFCPNVSPSIEIAFKHLKAEHNFDLISLKQKFQMDQYSYIKMINYIRRNNSKPSDFILIDKAFWNDDEYLKPREFESWLMYDFESFNDVDESTVHKSLEAEIKYLKELLCEKDDLLKQAHETIDKLRSGFRSLIEKNIDDEPNHNAIGVGSRCGKADEGYFSSYAHFSIHHDMLADSVRTLSYRDALIKNKDCIQGKTVLDVGCGTSILSMFASNAGAERIVAIDNSEIIYKAMDIARINNFTNIDFVKGRIEDTVLPIDKFDIIISEWMGYFLIFEGMLDSIIYARDHHLKVGGILMPNLCNISICGYSDEKRHQEYIKFWDSVYGYNMSILKKDVLQEPVVELCNAENVITDKAIIVEYNLNTITLNYSNFSYNFSLKVIKDGSLTSFVGYFDVYFKISDDREVQELSTSPFQEPTHWKQVVFFIEEPIFVKKNDVISGTIECKRNIKDMRSLDICINVFDKKYKYKLE